MFTFRQHSPKINNPIIFDSSVKSNPMGNISEGDFEAQFKQNYSFITLQDDTNFGMVKIYRKKQINFDYVMVYDQSLSGCTASERNKKLQELDYVMKNPHEQVLRLFHYEQIEKNAFECKVDVLRMYIEYYNFTLENLIENNARGRIYLCYDEILYIINSIISVYLYFQRIKANWFRIHKSQIYISTTGCVYFSPTQICRSLGDEVNGCLVQQTPLHKHQVLHPTDPQSSFQTLKNLMYDLIEHHSHVGFQQFHKIQAIFDTATTIQAIQCKMPKTTRTQLDMQKQIYRSEQTSSNNSTNSRQKISVSNSTSNVTLFPKERVKFKKY